MTQTGLIYVFTGEGKGKTSAAIGVAVRSLLLGNKVIWVSLYKQESWGLSEAKLKDKFPDLEMEFVGKGFRIMNSEQRILNIEGKEIKLATVGKVNKVVDTASEEEHREAANDGLQFAANSLQQKPFLLVIDEVLNAVSDGLLDERQVLDVLKKRGATHMVLTGRSGEATKKILEGADLVTECKKIKHPYDEGKLAVRGLDF